MSDFKITNMAFEEIGDFDGLINYYPFLGPLLVFS